MFLPTRQEFLGIIQGLFDGIVPGRSGFYVQLVQPDVGPGRAQFTRQVQDKVGILSGITKKDGAIAHKQSFPPQWVEMKIVFF
jgi:hypothetical protein